MTDYVKIYSASFDSSQDIPYFDGEIRAGFPSPAEDFVARSIDLNKEFIKNPSATFFGRVSGDSMQDVGIHDGDLLIIDKSLEPQNGKIAVCFIDGEFTVKQIEMREGGFFLVPANSKFKPLQVTEDNDFIVWGIVVHVIKSF
ncbi:MAG: translesion error-prone DNA polymerase V autoproteolytic subunit [Bacteroidales bacterium]